MPQTNFSRAQRVLANFTEANLTMSDFRDANLREAQFNKATFTMVNFSGANLHLADLRDTSITSDQLSSALSIRDARLPDGTLGRDSNLIINGHAECGTSLDRSWIVESGSVATQKSSSTNNECVFALRSHAIGASMRQRIDLSTVWKKNIWPYSRALFHARMNGSVSVELNGYDKMGKTVAQTQTSISAIKSSSF